MRIILIEAYCMKGVYYVARVTTSIKSRITIILIHATKNRKPAPPRILIYVVFIVIKSKGVVCTAKYKITSSIVYKN